MKHFLYLITFLPSLLFAQKEIGNIQQTQIEKHSFQLSWISNIDGVAAVEYGLNPSLELGIQSNFQKSNSIYTVTLQNLQPAHFYYARPLLINGIDTLRGSIGYYSTQSSSTGVIRIMFNKGVDSIYSTGTSPYISTGGTAIENELISMINAATSTIDIAMYNNTRTGIANALIAAHNSGVRVRYIANASAVTSNTALASVPFPVFYVNPTALMHNKFMIIDAATVNNSWVLGGSGNWTQTNFFNDYNNYVLIQDQALAQAYQLEFEEMWGGTGANYNTTLSKVGAAKTNNTPHTFNIGGRTVESYFSPSDGVTAEIESTIYSANNDIEICMFSYTKNELGTALKNQHQAGIQEHAIMENINDSGSEYTWLVGQGVNILHHNIANDIHHKYLIVDAGNSASDPQVLTGSHNWTNAAEDNNDENTLIIHDATIANLYLQEFTKRWCEVKNNIGCSLPFTTLSLHSIASEEQPILYPNPAQNQLTLHLPKENQKEITVILYNATGQIIKYFPLPANQMDYTLNIEEVENGMYFLQIMGEQTIWNTMLSVVK